MLHVSERTDWEAWRAVWGGVIRQGAAQCALAARLASAAKGLQGLRVRDVGWNRRCEISMNEKWVGDSVGLSVHGHFVEMQCGHDAHARPRNFFAFPPTNRELLFTLLTNDGKRNGHGMKGSPRTDGVRSPVSDSQMGVPIGTPTWDPQMGGPI